MDLPPQLAQKGIIFFNRGCFFEAHEVLEDVWRAAPGSEKKFWQGLVQVAVGFHHYSTGNRTGAASVLARASQNLRTFSIQFCGIQLSPLLESLAEWKICLQEGRAEPPLPVIEFFEEPDSTECPGCGSV
jgi:predicted metal-dependent hydrolase